MKRNSAGKNYFFNLSYQILLILLPLVTTPYVSRVLTPTGVGAYSLSFSYITYFTLLSAFGFTYYAQREIAKCAEDREKQATLFWEILLARLFPVVLSLALNNALIFAGVYGDNTVLMRIFNINILACAFDITFLFQGNEEFGKTVAVNLGVKLLGVASIFLFVRTAADLWLYTLLNALVLFGSNLLLWLFAPKRVRRKEKTRLHPMRHLGPAARLFLPNIAISMYTVLDKSLIGIITADRAQNGFYEEAEKIVKCAMTVITSLGTVMIPRNAREFAAGNTDAVKNNVCRSVHFVFLLGLPLATGIALCAGNLVPWFLGEDYGPAVLLLKLFAPLIPIIGLSNVFGLQYLIPGKRDRHFTRAILIGAVTNFALNIPLIFRFGARGAVIASVAAEAVVTLVMLGTVRRDFSLSRLFLPVWRPAVGTAAMAAALFPLAAYFTPSVSHTLLLALIGAALYFLLLLLLRDPLLWDVLAKAKEKLKRKNQAS